MQRAPGAWARLNDSRAPRLTAISRRSGDRPPPRAVPRRTARAIARDPARVSGPTITAADDASGIPSHLAGVRRGLRNPGVAFSPEVAWVAMVKAPATARAVCQFSAKLTW